MIFGVIAAILGLIALLILFGVVSRGAVRSRHTRNAQQESTRCPFRDGDRIRHKVSGVLATVVIAEDANGDSHVDQEGYGMGIMGPSEWAAYEVVTPPGEG